VPGASRGATRAWHSRFRPHGGSSKVKERLTGAIILVALIVLLVPELLTGPVRSAPRTAAAEAAAEGAPLRSYTINLSDDSRTRAAEAQASGPDQPAPLAPPAAPENSLPAPQPQAPAPAPRPAAGTNDSAPPPAAPAPTPTPVPSRPAAHAALAVPAVAGGAFVVQLGSFASRDNAERLAREVRARGFPVSVSQAATGRRLYRVRVGPTRDRAAAEELAGKLRGAGHSGTVVPR